MKKLNNDEIKDKLASFSAWSLKEGKLYRQFAFPDFKAAFKFMTAVSEVAERMQHHPEWTNVYNKVDVCLTTHDVGGISEKDFELATEMDRLS